MITNNVSKDNDSQSNLEQDDLEPQTDTLDLQDSATLKNDTPKHKKNNQILLITIIICVSVIIGIFILSATSSKDKPSVVDQGNKSNQSDNVSKNLADSQGTMGVELLQKLYTPNENNFISPSSISLALSMAYNGATGSTKEEMRKVMHLNDISYNELNIQNQNFINLLNKTDQAVITSVANSVWADVPAKSNNNFTLKQDYQDTLSKFYGGKANVVDLQSDDAKNKINSWVAQNTKNKIPTLIDKKLPEGHVYMLLNAIYFKGTWKYTFDKENTQPAEFSSASGTKKNVPMMTQNNKLKYYQDNDIQIVQMPYGKNASYSMDIILPKNTKSFVDTLRYSQLNEYSKKLKEKDGTLLLPRFKTEFAKNLNDSLQQLGMQKVFKDEAELTGISQVKSKVSEVIHKTFLEVNEEGSEAAAVTSVGGDVTTSVGDPSDSFYMNVNKPFVILIKENKTNIPLFLGVINKIDL
jgi:serine protease inhibitor